MENQPVNIVIEQIAIPSFSEFFKINESVEAETKLYSEIVDRVDQLRNIYGEKNMSKTGIIKALEAINRVILTGEKENQPQSQTQVQAQPQPQVQAQPQPQAQAKPAFQPQAQAQPAFQPQAQAPAQDTTQPQAQK